MALDRTDIENIAWLARLSLSEIEMTDYRGELVKILELVEQMNGIKTDTIKPLAHPLEIGARLREDRVTETDRRDENLKSAPEVEAGFYLVPRVIE